jgi:hypothetical protein
MFMNLRNDQCAENSAEVTSVRTTVPKWPVRGKQCRNYQCAENSAEVTSAQKTVRN